MTASDRAAQRWHFVVDNLDTHRSESLVRWVARESRAVFLSDPSHRIVFHYTPKHTSWMNQVEIWLSILVRKLLQRGSFKSVTDLKQKVLDFIDYYNRTMAECTFVDTGLRRCDEGFCSFRLRKLKHCRLPKQTLGIS